MAYSITPSDDGKYIIMKVTGNFNRQLAMQYNLESHTLGKSLGINRYLVDLTEARNLNTTVEDYEFAYKDMKTPEIDRTAIVAVMVSPGDHSHDFIETVARNAGLNTRLFTDRDLAIRHLLQAG
ncbi:MAG: hypothetical protein RBT47_08645 [Anaerolineae bacterium]|jgi:hypothetical protein|nr:hypothetical protein [Anaerolineae bacterium]